MTHSNIKQHYRQKSHKEKRISWLFTPTPPQRFPSLSCLLCNPEDLARNLCTSSCAPPAWLQPGELLWGSSAVFVPAAQQSHQGPALNTTQPQLLQHPENHPVCLIIDTFPSKTQTSHLSAQAESSPCAAVLFPDLLHALLSHTALVHGTSIYPTHRNSS